MCLELDRPCGEDRRACGHRIILQHRVIDDSFAVEPDGHPFADHDDLEFVPFAEWAVHLSSGSLPGRPGLLFQSPPEPLSAPMGKLLGVGGVPNLHLRHAAQINPAIGLRDGLVFEAATRSRGSSFWS